MTPTSYTFNGQTVSFNDTQRALLFADQALIIKLNNDIAEWDRQIAVHTATANHWNNIYANECPQKQKYDDRVKCSNEAIFMRDQAYADRASVINQKQLTLEQLSRAQKQLNNDLILIQDQIKFDIQAQTSNTDTNTEINNNTPQAISDRAKITAEANKLKQEQTLKIVGFVLLAGTIIALGVFLIRRL